MFFILILRNIAVLELFTIYKDSYSISLFGFIPTDNSIVIQPIFASKYQIQCPLKRQHWLNQLQWQFMHVDELECL